MPLISTPDGRYLFAVETAGEGDGNSVVYDRGVPVWDRFSYERAAGPDQGVPPETPPQTPVTPSPVPPPASDTIPHVIRVTDERDGTLLNRGYSYWPQAWVGGSSVFVFVAHEDGRSRFFEISLRTGEVTRLGAMVGFTGGEGWYWNRNGSIYLIDGPRLRLADPWTNDAPVVFDITETHPGCDLWQAHSSDDGQVHSATVRRVVQDGPYPHIGTVVCYQGQQIFFDAHGELDESQITPDGGWVVIKESFPLAGKKDLTNRVIAIPSRETQVLHNWDGAVGHSDCGLGILVGEWSPQFDPSQQGACVLWDLTRPLVPTRRRELFQSWNVGHLSIRNGRSLRSSDIWLSLVDLETGQETPVAPHGMAGSGYDYQVFANLDYTGRVAAYVSNHGTGRYDLDLLIL